MSGSPSHFKANKIPSTNTTISGFPYGVINIGQRTGVQTTGTAFPSQPADWTWGYHALGQVTSADSPTAGFDRAYEYDQIGNRKKSADGTLETTGTSALVYEPNPLNQYSEIQNQQSAIVNPVYDADGNATAYPLPVAPTANATLAYDAENRLVSVTTGTTTVSYVYDSQSRRIARLQGSSVTLYLYDAWNCLAEYSLQNSSFTILNSFSWGLDLSGTLQGAGGVGGLLSVTKHEAPPTGSGQASTTHYYPTFDGNGNISEYLTASGTIAAHYEYDPFGRTIVASGDNAGDFAYLFSTKPVDAATGLYYYGYRHYDPVTGRWPSRDPIEESGGVNLYGFVGNDGIRVVDRLGLEPEKIRLAFSFNRQDPSLSQWKEKLLTHNISVGSIQDLLEKIQEKVGNDRGKKCLDHLVIWFHGHEGGIIIDDNTSINADSFAALRNAERFLAEGKSLDLLGAVGKETAEMLIKLREIKCYLCPEPTIHIHACYAGKGDAGQKLESELSKMFGVSIDLPAAACRPTIGGGIEYRTHKGREGVPSDREGNPLEAGKP